MDIPHGAVLEIVGYRYFPPKFDEESSNLWGAMVSPRLNVLDDRTADGDDDDKEFSDRFDLKFDAEVAKQHGIGPEEGAKDSNGKKLSLTKFLKNANKRNFNPEQQAALLDENNWVVQEETKLANLLACLQGPNWELDLDNLQGKRFIGKVEPRTKEKVEGSAGSGGSLQSPRPTHRRGNRRGSEPRPSRRGTCGLGQRRSVTDAKGSGRL